MKKFLLLCIILIVYSCSKPKSVLICGDHVCVNKTEAKQYFEENLTLEVKIINDRSKKEIDLVELNLKPEKDGKKKISVTERVLTKQKIKVLSNDEIKEKKAEIKRKEKIKIKKVKVNKKKVIRNEIEIAKKNNIENKKKISDICTLIKECNIEEISKYLVKEGMSKKFPDITIREN